MGVGVEITDNEGGDRGVKGRREEVGQAMAQIRDIVVDGEEAKGVAVVGSEFYQKG